MKVRRITKRKVTASRKGATSPVFERVSPVRVSNNRTSDSVRPVHATRAWSLPSRVVATALVLFFVLVPVGDAFADTSEVIAVPSPVVEEPTPEVSEEVVPEPVPEEIVLVNGADAVEVTEEIVPEVTPIAENEVTPAPQDVVATSSDDEASETTDPTPTDTTDVSTSTPSSGETPVVESTETATSSEPIPDEVATTTVPTEEIVEPIPVEPTPIATTTATTTEETVATTTDESVEVSTHTTDADRFTFGVTECVAMGNGAFQCVRGGESGTVSEASGPLYAKKDAEGDMEIYLSSETGTRPITANNYDDDAPSADSASGDIVWQAQIDDRMQIMHYNRETGATTRITKEAYNSMQPSIYEGDIVFQSWIGNDWEIVVVDDIEGREILTDNSAHDITPSITKDFIMWQSFEGEEWVGKVYDRRTKEIETVRGMDGGKVENPRMIMVFDSTKENGDTDTLGYDPVTGEVVSLAVTPVPVAPERIPEPEPEQEEKAMVQPTVTTRTETKNSTSTDSGEDTNATSTEPIVAPVATTSADGVPTLDLATDEPEQGVDEMLVIQVLPVIPDLVIPAFSSTANDEATTTAGT